MSSPISLLVAVALGPLAARARHHLPKSDAADIAVLAPLVAFAAFQPAAGALAWLRLALLIFTVGRIAGVSGERQSAGDTPGYLHLLPFVPALAAGADAALDLWSLTKTLLGLCLAAVLITRRTTVERWAAVVFLLAPVLGRLA